MIGKVTARAIPITDYQEEHYKNHVIISAKEDGLIQVVEVWPRHSASSKPAVTYKGNSRTACIARAKKWVDKR